MLRWNRIDHCHIVADLRSDPISVGCNIFWEQAEPLANMLLGAKHAGRPRIVSRIIVEEYCAF
jgi:hypothetical protein